MKGRGLTSSEYRGVVSINNSIAKYEYSRYVARKSYCVSRDRATGCKFNRLPSAALHPNTNVECKPEWNHATLRAGKGEHCYQGYIKCLRAMCASCPCFPQPYDNASPACSAEYCGGLLVSVCVYILRVSQAPSNDRMLLPLSATLCLVATRTQHFSAV